MAVQLPLRILLAEDNAVNQKLALRLLAQMGYRADVAGNGIEAIQALEQVPYDVVLMDVQMPEMDGLEAARRICARWPQGERPRIIAMTANAMQGDREECLAAGMDDYLAKPIHVDELVKALSQCQALPHKEKYTMTDMTMIDRTALDNLLASVDGDMDFFAELLEVYFDDSPAQIAAMQAAVAAGDAEACAEPRTASNPTAPTSAP